jgi:hypothetical protein
VVVAAAVAGAAAVVAAGADAAVAAAAVVAAAGLGDVAASAKRLPNLVDKIQSPGRLEPLRAGHLFFLLFAVSSHLQ